jgi:hypothetical protein
MPSPPDAPGAATAKTESQKRDVFEAVQSGFIDELKAWGISAWETQDACAAKHREMAH